MNRESGHTKEPDALVHCRLRLDLTGSTGDFAVTPDTKETPVVRNENENDEQEFVETVVMPDQEKPESSDPEDRAFTT